MKTAFFTLLIAVLSFNAFSQTLPPIANVQMTTKEDYRAKDSLALQVANYVLSTPSNENSVDRLSAASFLLKWMDGTPDYSFELSQNVLQYFQKDIDLMSVYMACMTAYALQNHAKDAKTITLNAVKLFVTYIDKSSNNVKMTSKLKKLSEANQKGELESFLKF
jgi:cellobiose-specific phosphotransferase system component IIC